MTRLQKQHQHHHHQQHHHRNHPQKQQKQQAQRSFSCSCFGFAYPHHPPRTTTTSCNSSRVFATLTVVVVVVSFAAIVLLASEGAYCFQSRNNVMTYGNLGNRRNHILPNNIRRNNIALTTRQHRDFDQQQQRQRQHQNIQQKQQPLYFLHQREHEQPEDHCCGPMVSTPQKQTMVTTNLQRRKTHTNDPHSRNKPLTRSTMNVLMMILKMTRMIKTTTTSTTMTMMMMHSSNDIHNNIHNDNGNDNCSYDRSKIIQDEESYMEGSNDFIRHLNEERMRDKAMIMLKNESASVDVKTFEEKKKTMTKRWKGKLLDSSFFTSSGFFRSRMRSSSSDLDNDSNNANNNNVTKKNDTNATTAHTGSKKDNRREHRSGYSAVAKSFLSTSGFPFLTVGSTNHDETVTTTVSTESTAHTTTNNAEDSMVGIPKKFVARSSLSNSSTATNDYVLSQQQSMIDPSITIINPAHEIEFLPTATMNDSVTIDVNDCNDNNPNNNNNNDNNKSFDTTKSLSLESSLSPNIVNNNDDDTVTVTAAATAEGTNSMELYLEEIIETSSRSSLLFSSSAAAAAAASTSIPTITSIDSNWNNYSNASSSSSIPVELQSFFRMIDKEIESLSLDDDYEYDEFNVNKDVAYRSTEAVVPVSTNSTSLLLSLSSSAAAAAGAELAEEIADNSNNANLMFTEQNRQTDDANNDPSRFFILDQQYDDTVSRRRIPATTETTTETDQQTVTNVASVSWTQLLSINEDESCNSEKSVLKNAVDTIVGSIVPEPLASATKAVTFPRGFDQTLASLSSNNQVVDGDTIWHMFQVSTRTNIQSKNYSSSNYDDDSDEDDDDDEIDKIEVDDTFALAAVDEAVTVPSIATSRGLAYTIKADDAQAENTRT